MVTILAKGGGAKKSKAQFVGGVFPKGGVGGSGKACLPLTDLKCNIAQLNGAGRLPLFEGSAEIFVEGGDLAMVEAVSTELNGSTTPGIARPIDRADIAQEAGEGEGFFGLVVVKFGGEAGVDLAYLIEKPGVEPVGVVAGEGAGLDGLKGNLESNEVWLTFPQGSFRGHSLWVNSRLLS
jgi:hypothetical protein